MDKILWEEGQGQGQWGSVDTRDLRSGVLAWAPIQRCCQIQDRGSVGPGCKRTSGWWHSAKDTFSDWIPCQVQPEEPGDLTLAWCHRAPGGGWRGAPSSPATHQPALTSTRHQVSPASICCLLPPSPSACLFFFQSHRLPQRQSSKRGGVLETSLCPLQPHYASQPWRGWRGRLGPAGRRHPRRPGFRQPLAPRSAGGIRSRRESSPGLRVLGRGSGRLSACFGPSPCSLSAPLGESGRIGLGPQRGGPQAPASGCPYGPRSLDLRGCPQLRPGQHRQLKCADKFLFPSPPDT